MQLEHRQLLFIYAPCCLFPWTLCLGCWTHCLGCPNCYWMCHIRFWTFPLTSTFLLHYYDAELLQCAGSFGRGVDCRLVFQCVVWASSYASLVRSQTLAYIRGKHSTKQVHVLVRLGFKYASMGRTSVKRPNIWINYIISPTHSTRCNNLFTAHRRAWPTLIFRILDLLSLLERGSL